MKSIVLMATALFLVSAPAPDSRDIAELTSNFIVPTGLQGLEASEVAPDHKRGDELSDQQPGVSLTSLESRSPQPAPVEDELVHYPPADG